MEIFIDDSYEGLFLELLVYYLKLKESETV